MVTEELKNLVFTLMHNDKGLDREQYFCLLEYLNTISEEFAEFVEFITDATDDGYHFSTERERSNLNIERKGL